MNKRIAFIGTSSPIFYDYKSTGRRLKSEKYSSPNPVLDGAGGLLLLFDEIWFLSKCFCPRNMRHLNYVKFLDEMNLINFSNFSIPKYQDVYQIENGKFEKITSAFFKNYNKHVYSKGIIWDCAPDNHTHQLNIQNTEVTGNSASLPHIIYDLNIYQSLNNPNIEFITNSISQKWLDISNNNLNEIEFTHEIIIPKIPNIITKNGPYHESFEELREHQYLSDFRKFVIQETKNINPKEIKERVESVRKSVEDFQANILRKYFDKNQYYLNFSKTFLGVAIDSLVPMLNPIKTITDEYKNYKESKNKRWQAFLLDVGKTRKT